MRKWALLAILALAACETDKQIDTEDITDETGETGESGGPTDQDGDGYLDDADCDDTDASVNPGADETPYDGIDNDCNPSTPDDDLDGDGVPQSEDCDDTDAEVYPGNTEVCDGKDNDCDESIDNDAIDASTWYADSDGDGYGFAEAEITDCEQPNGFSSFGNDCDDARPDVYPGATEVCGDGIDNDCSGGDAACP